MIYSRMLQDPIIKKNNMNIITDKIEKFILELKNVWFLITTIIYLVK